MTENEHPSGNPMPASAPATFESAPPAAPPPVPPVPGGTPPGAPVRKPHGRQLLILLLGGGVLAFGGCALFLGTVNFNTGNSSVVGVIFAIAFVVGAGMFAIGCILALVLIVTAIFRTDRR